MIYIVQNLVPILLATLVALFVGGLFHGRRGYSATLVLTAFVAEFWFTAILAGALILAPAKADPWVMAIGTAVVIWAGFVMPATVVTLRSRGVGVGGVVRDVARWLVTMIVAAVVLHAVGLTAPTP